MKRIDQTTPSAPVNDPGDSLPQAQLSALVDGELDAAATRFLLRRLEHDGELRRSWEQWHLAGACLRRTPLALLPAGFAARVGAALDAEAAPRRSGSPLRWAGGAAVAASVALLALLAARPPEGSTPVPAAPVASSGQVAEAPVREQDLRPDSARVPARTVAATSGPQLATDRYGRSVITDPRIEAYLVRHNQALQAQGRGGFMPYVQVVAQPAQGTVRPASDGAR